VNWNLDICGACRTARSVSWEESCNGLGWKGSVSHSHIYAVPSA
jgi:hypothetical protein